MKKGYNVKLEMEVHWLLEKVQTAEAIKFSYPKERTKIDLLVDIIKLGIPAFIKTHNLEL